MKQSENVFHGGGKNPKIPKRVQILDFQGAFNHCLTSALLKPYFDDTRSVWDISGEKNEISKICLPARRSDPKDSAGAAGEGTFPFSHCVYVSVSLSVDRTQVQTFSSD